MPTLPIMAFLGNVLPLPLHRRACPLPRVPRFGNGPPRRGGPRPALALEETPFARCPWGSRATRLEPPREATRWPLRTCPQPQPVPGPWTGPRGGGQGVSPPNPEKGRAGPTSGSLPRPPPAPPPSPHKAAPEAAARPAREGGRLDAAGPATRASGPRRPPIAGEAGAPVPGRARTRGGVPARPSRRGDPEAPPPRPPNLRRRVPEKARRGPRIPLATPEVAASGVESPGRRGAPKASGHGNERVGGRDGEDRQVAGDPWGPPQPPDA